MKNEVFKVKVSNPDAWGGLDAHYGEILEVRRMDDINPVRDNTQFYQLVSQIGFVCIKMEDCKKVQTHNVIGGQLDDDGTTPKAVRDRERSSRSR